MFVYPTDSQEVILGYIFTLVSPWGLMENHLFQVIEYKVCVEN